MTVLTELQNRGLIRHLGLSNVTPAQLAEAQKVTYDWFGLAQMARAGFDSRYNAGRSIRRT